MVAEDRCSRLSTEVWTYPDRHLEIVCAGPRNSSPPIVFVHGVCHGAWCWHHFLGYFADRGYHTIAMSLRGHGASSGREQLHQLRLEDYVDDVVRVVERLGHKAVLVGHSMGGAIVQRYIARYTDTVCATVLFASATAGGLGGARFAHALLGNRPRALLNGIRIAVGRSGSDINDSPFFSNRLSRRETDVYRPLLGPESRRAIRDLLRRFDLVPHDIPPVLVIGSRNDDLFGEWSQRTTARFYGVSPVLLDEPCHDMMLDPQWRLAADQVLAFLQANVDSANESSPSTATAPERHPE